MYNISKTIYLCDYYCEFSSDAKPTCSWLHVLEAHIKGFDWWF